jgi:tripartite-type tricarboxylate transporter receptor subunit TctC
MLFRLSFEFMLPPSLFVAMLQSIGAARANPFDFFRTNLTGNIHVTRRLAALLLSLFSTAVLAQAYPQKPIRMVVGYAPGGPNDTQARLIGEKLTASLGQQVIVDNRAGATGIIGTTFVAKSPPDGYTLMLISAGHTIIGNFQKLPFHPIDDFTPVTQVSSSPFVLVVHPSLPVRSVSGLIQLAKTRPGQLTYASAGNGSSLQTAMELFNSMAGVKMVHVPYKGGGPATIDLIAGHVQLMMNNAVGSLPAARAGKLRALGVTSAKRSAAAPELPTIGETLPGYEADAWYGVIAPRGTPAAIVSTLRTEIAKSLHNPEVRQRLAALGLEPVGGTPQEFGAFLQNEIVKWAKVVKDANIKAE